MYQFIPMRDFDVSPFIMFLAVALVLGIGMLMTGIIAMVWHGKNTGTYKVHGWQSSGWCSAQ